MYLEWHQLYTLLGRIQQIFTQITFLILWFKWGTPFEKTVCMCIFKTKSNQNEWSEVNRGCQTASQTPAYRDSATPTNSPGILSSAFSPGNKWGYKIQDWEPVIQIHFSNYITRGLDWKSGNLVHMLYRMRCYQLYRLCQALFKSRFCDLPAMGPWPMLSNLSLSSSVKCPSYLSSQGFETMK